MSSSITSMDFSKEQPQPPQRLVSFVVQNSKGKAEEVQMAPDALVSDLMAKITGVSNSPVPRADPHQGGAGEEEVVGPEAAFPFRGRFFLDGEELKPAQTLEGAGVRTESIVVFEEASASDDVPPKAVSSGESQAVSMTSSLQAGVVAFSDEKKDFAVMVSMQAPTLDDVKRVPIDLVLVIDRYN